ncbi:MAG TPA: EamA family transporter [Roseiarcus sp.]|nr:EamA family transporter [Roseiarcus sp.]
MRKLLFPALVALFSLVWSSAFIVAKVALVDFDPATILTLRFALSAALLLALPGCSLARLRETLPIGATLGLLNNAAYLGLTFTALQYVRPVVVVVIVSCAPFMTTLLAAIAGVERANGLKLLGVAVGFVGVLIIAGWNLGGDPIGVLLAGAGAAAFSFATVVFRAKAAALPVRELNFWQSLAGALALAPFAILFGRGLGAASLPGALAILYLAMVVTIGGMGLWMILIRASGAGSASAYHLMNPFFGVVLSAAILGAPMRGADFLGAAVIAIGLFVTMTASKQGQPVREAASTAR